MNHLPPDLQYARTHEWVRHETKDRVAIGITDHAQQSLGDITYIQLPKVGTRLTAGAVFGVIESVKAASDLYAPVTGTVVAVNELLDANPGTVNQSPYEGGWMVRVGEVETATGLLSAEDYRALLG